uniref:Uncharacterized protein n=1 Tax=Oryza nivara TaxID=4536 RepID=A0A0E0GXL3_ORYNI
MGADPASSTSSLKATSCRCSRRPTK